MGSASRLAVVASLSLAMLVPGAASAQPKIDMRPTPAPAEPGAIPLNTGGMAGMPPESWFVDQGKRAVRNVSNATLTPVLPDPAKATGAAVIVLPGGAFKMLSMDNEGWPVARWLADHGVAAFVLKYRTLPSAPTQEGFNAEVMAAIADAMAGHAKLDTPPQPVEDARAALRLVRARAGEWGVDLRRVGMLGFSAGAMTSLTLTLKSTDEGRPAFLATVYGPMVKVEVPAAAPPMFVALAADDPLFGRQGFGLVESWEAAGKPVELHLYEHGGHGFGLGRDGDTASDWIASFHHWLGSNGFLKPRG